MPTYDYKCKKCDYTFDVFQGINDLPLKICPSCSTESLKRLVGAGAGIIFKGTGFYQTDYRSEKYKEAKQKDLESSKATSSKKEPAKKSSKTVSSSSQ